MDQVRGGGRRKRRSVVETPRRHPTLDVGFWSPQLPRQGCHATRSGSHVSRTCGGWVTITLKSLAVKWNVWKLHIYFWQSNFPYTWQIGVPTLILNRFFETVLERTGSIWVLGSNSSWGWDSCTERSNLSGCTAQILIKITGNYLRHVPLLISQWLCSHCLSGCLLFWPRFSILIAFSWAAPGWIIV